MPMIEPMLVEAVRRRLDRQMGDAFGRQLRQRAVQVEALSHTWRDRFQQQIEQLQR